MSLCSQGQIIAMFCWRQHVALSRKDRWLLTSNIILLTKISRSVGPKIVAWEILIKTLGWK